MNTINCPQCEHEREPNSDPELNKATYTCESCGFEFFCMVDYDPIYRTFCTTHTFDPFREGYVRCRLCFFVKAVTT